MDLERDVLQWITSTDARNTVRAHALTRITPLMLRKIFLPHARLQLIFTAPAKVKRTSFSSSWASSQSVKFYDLAVKDPELALQAVASNTPL